jgi:hypothetical protein
MKKQLSLDIKSHYSTLVAASKLLRSYSQFNFGFLDFDFEKIQQKMSISSVLTAVNLSLLSSSAHSQLWCNSGIRVARSSAFTVALLSSHCTKAQGYP